MNDSAISHKSSISGSFDGIKDGCFFGWAKNGDVPVELEFKINGEGVGSAKADLYRPDLANAKIGDHAFSMSIPEAFQDGVAHEVLVLDVQTGQPLLKTPTVIMFPKSEKANTSAVKAVELNSAPQKKIENRTPEIVVFPDYRSTNPYQDLLYSEVSDPYRVVYADFDYALKLVEQENAPGTIFHLHWPEVIFAGARDRLLLFRAREKEFFAKLTRFKQAGGIFYWTVHNKQAHTPIFLEDERAYYQKLINYADRVLVHSEPAVRSLQEIYKLDENKVVVIEHGNFKTAYPNEISKQDARIQLGLAEDDVVFTFLGQLRPYKGIEQLTSAFQRLLSIEPRARLVIAGAASWPTQKGYWQQRAKLLDGMHVFEEFIPDNELQLYMNAADFVALPYTDILTSGSAQLAISYDRPVIIPDLPTLEFLKEGGCAISYSAGSAEDLFEALKFASSLSRDDHNKMQMAASALADKFDWTTISTKLAEEVSSNVVLSKEQEITVDDKVRKLHHLHSKNTNNKKIYDRNIRIIIVVYKSIPYLQRLINSIPREVDGWGVGVTILDNSEDLNFSKLLKRKFPYTDVWALEENLGYAGANNVGLTQALNDGAEKVFILNPDVELSENTISELLKYSNESDGSGKLISPMVLNGNDSSKCAFGGNQRLSNGELSPLFDGNSHVSLPKVPYDSATLQGCSIWADTETIKKIGYMPEEYFLYFEETEWCERASQNGHGCQILPSAQLLHFKGTQKFSLPAIHYVYYFLRATQLYALRNELSLADTRAKFETSFVDPWYKKIGERLPQFAQSFKLLAAKALDDGAKGITGQVDLSEILEGLTGTSKIRTDNDSAQVAGCVDQIKYLKDENIIELHGWAAQKPDQGEWQPAEIWVSIDGVVVGGATSLEKREDVAAGGFGLNVGFRVQLPEEFFDGGAHQLEVRHETGESLKTVMGNPVILPKAKTSAHVVNANQPAVRIRVDGARHGKVFGWAVADSHPDIPLRIQVYCDGELIGDVDADIYRRDLADAHIGNGNCGFSIPVPLAIWNNKESMNVSVHEYGQDKEITARHVELQKDNFKKNFALDNFMKWSFVNKMPPDGTYDNHESLKSAFEANYLYYSTLAKQVSHSPKISVIMPSYNRRNVIVTAIQSVLNQTYQNFELIVVDDGSYDLTSEVVEKNFPNDVSLIKMPYNKGVSAARNVGLKAATGDFIAYLDTDNQWDPEYLSIMVAAFSEHPDAQTAYSGQEIWQAAGAANEFEQRTIRCCPFNRGALEVKNFIDLNVFMHKRELFDIHGGFREDMTRLVDWELILRYTREIAPVFIPCLLNIYNIGKVENQITAIEKFDKNIAKLYASLV